MHIIEINKYTNIYFVLYLHNLILLGVFLAVRFMYVQYLPLDSRESEGVEVFLFLPLSFWVLFCIY